MSEFNCDKDVEQSLHISKLIAFELIFTFNKNRENNIVLKPIKKSDTHLMVI